MQNLPDYTKYNFTPQETLNGNSQATTIKGLWQTKPAILKQQTTDITNILQTIQTLHEHNLGPQLYFTDPETNIIIIQLLEGQTALQKQPTPQQLAKLLNQTKQLPETTTLPSLKDFLTYRLTNTVETPASSTPKTQQQKQQALHTLHQMPPSTQAIHADLSRGNIIHTPEGLKLIDPRGLSGDWHYDLTVTSWKNRYTHEQHQQLLQLTNTDPQLINQWLTIAQTARV